MPYMMEQLGVDGSIFVKNTAGQWETFPRGSVEANLYLQLLQTNGTVINLPNTLSPNSSFPSYPSQGNSLSGYTLVSFIISLIALSLFAVLVPFVSWTVYTQQCIRKGDYKLLQKPAND